MNEANPSAAPLLVFADDWGRHPSSCQHLIRRLLDRRPVWWVNTIGMRRPRFDLATLRRGLEKLRQWTGRSTVQGEQPANLHVVNPWMWPYLSTRFDRWLNRELLLRQLRRLLRTLPVPPVVVTILPVVADLIGRLPVRRWVYYCVDDFSTWPGLDQEPLRGMEEIVVERADRLITVSEPLQARLAALGRESALLTHGVDLEFWQGRGPRVEMPGLEDLSRPLLLFFGSVDRRMDVAWVKRLSAELDTGTILLAGPLVDPDPELLRLPRVVHLPPVAFEHLPHLAREAAVLLMPYTDEPVTRAMQPLKLKEYLATGKPVVVRDLPANQGWADCLDLATTAEQFARAVRLRLVTGLPGNQREARARLASESWDEKARCFERWLDEEEPAAERSPGVRWRDPRLCDATPSG
jgi:glycosyltransferase involved in cell wall biosynthesis